MLVLVTLFSIPILRSSIYSYLPLAVPISITHNNRTSQHLYTHTHACTHVRAHTHTHCLFWHKSSLWSLIFFYIIILLRPELNSAFLESLWEYGWVRCRFCFWGHVTMFDVFKSYDICFSLTMVWLLNSKVPPLTGLLLTGWFFCLFGIFGFV